MGWIMAQVLRLAVVKMTDGAGVCCQPDWLCSQCATATKLLAIADEIERS